MKKWLIDWNKDLYANDKTRKKKALLKLDYFKYIIEQYDNPSILDVGCGGGYVAELLYEKAELIVAIDICESAISNTYERLSNKKSQVINHDLEDEFELNRTFDIIIAFGILEHVNNSDQCIKTLFKHLKPSGVCLVTWSNTYSFLSLQHFLLSVTKKWRFGFQREISMSILNKLMHSNGLTIIHSTVAPCDGSVSYWSKLDAGLHTLLPSFGRYLYAVCRRN